jgi:hypothetical protein
MDRDEIIKIAHDVVTARFQAIGIYDGDPEHMEKTRANFRLLEEIRTTREANKGSFRRVLLAMFSGSGQILWVTLLAALTWVLPLIVKAILKAIQ